MDTLYIDEFEINELELVEAPSMAWWIGLGAGLLIGAAAC